jgi:exonuclease III
MEIHRPEILVIMETRVDPNKLRKSFELLGFDSFACASNSGFAGGIVIGWKSSLLTIKIERVDFQFIHVRVLETDGCWYFSAIYASPNEDMRKTFWNEMIQIANNITERWLLAGDFNDIKDNSEKKGGAAIIHRKCALFAERINRCRLIDLGSIGSRYTWRGPLYNGVDRIYERLDRALCNDAWRISFPNVIVKVLPRVDFSDHHPILIQLGGVQVPCSEKIFRFKCAWTLHPQFDEDFKSWWRQDHDLVSNLAEVETNLKSWKVHTFGSILKRKKELHNRLGGIQKKIPRGWHESFPL